MERQKCPTFICPKCGKRIPVDASLAEEVRHVVYARKKRAKVLCPRMFGNRWKKRR